MKITFVIKELKEKKKNFTVGIYSLVIIYPRNILLVGKYTLMKFTLTSSGKMSLEITIIFYKSIIKL